VTRARGGRDRRGASRAGRKRPARALAGLARDAVSGARRRLPARTCWCGARCRGAGVRARLPIPTADVAASRRSAPSAPRRSGFTVIACACVWLACGARVSRPDPVEPPAEVADGGDFAFERADSLAAGEVEVGLG